MAFFLACHLLFRQVLYYLRIVCASGKVNISNIIGIYKALNQKEYVNSFFCLTVEGDIVNRTFKQDRVTPNNKCSKKVLQLPFARGHSRKRKCFMYSNIIAVVSNHLMFWPIYRN